MFHVLREWVALFECAILAKARILDEELTIHKLIPCGSFAVVAIDRLWNCLAATQPAGCDGTSSGGPIQHQDFSFGTHGLG